MLVRSLAASKQPLNLMNVPRSVLEVRARTKIGCLDAGTCMYMHLPMDL